MHAEQYLLQLLCQQNSNEPDYILEADLLPASKDVLLSAAACRYLQGLKKPDRPSDSYCLAHPFNLSATNFGPSKSAHLIKPPLQHDTANVILGKEVL